MQTVTLATSSIFESEPTGPYRRSGTLQGRGRFTRDGTTAKLPVGPQFGGVDRWTSQGWELAGGGLDDPGGGGAGHTPQETWPEKMSAMSMPIKPDR